MNHNHNNYCDGSRCQNPDGEVRVLPTGGGGNVILCRACFHHEINWRRDRNRDLSREAAFELPEWESLEVYRVE